MSLKRSVLTSAQKPSIAMPTPPLGRAELAIVRDVLADAAPEWSVELNGICVDEATLVLLPEGGDDAMGPSFVISRESFGFRLDQLHWDTMQEIGCYPTLAEVIAAVRSRLELIHPPNNPVSLTRH